MGDTFKLAMQLTMIDLMSGVAQGAKRKILEMGEAGKQVARDFDLMERHAARGLKSIAVSNYTVNKMKPGVQAAADLQESLINVKMNIMESGQDAKDLNAQLAKVRSTATDLQKIAPFSAQEVVDIENVFLKAGVKLNDITAKGGAAWAATALATITQEAPASIAEGMVSIAAPFNLKGGQYGELADFLQKVDTASITSVPLLVEGMKEVSGTAAQLKISYQDTATALGVIAQNGLKGTAGGTALNDFLIRLTGTSRHARQVMKALGLEFWDQKGKLKPLVEIIEILRKKYGKLTDHQAQFAMQKVFEIQGSRAAFALMHQGEGSWEAINENIKKTISLQDKVTERLKGLNSSFKSLAGSSKTTLATLFDPLLEPLTFIGNQLNEIVTNLGKFAEEHPAVAKGASYGLAGAGVLAGGYGLWQLGKAGKYGGRVLKGLRGTNLSSIAVGVAEGKALEKAAGVTPVFVTNWPADGGMGATAGMPGVPPSAGGKRWWNKGIPPVPLGMALQAGGMMMVPATGAAIVGGASRYGMQKLADYHASMMTTQGLMDLRARQMVMGGGINSSQVQTIDAELAKREAAENAMKFKNDLLKNDIKIELSIDGQGRVFSRSDSMNTNVSLTKRGNFFDSLLMPES